MNASNPQRHPAPRTVEFDLRVTLPAGTPMIDVAQAMTDLAATVNGHWSYRKPAGAARGYFEVEGQP